MQALRIRSSVVGARGARAPLRVTVAGELDLGTCDRLEALLVVAEWALLPVVLDLTEVTFADSSGLQPIVESVRRRRAAGLPGLSLVAPGRAAARILALLGVAWAPEIDVDAWDAAALVTSAGAAGAPGSRRSGAAARAPARAAAPPAPRPAG